MYEYVGTADWPRASVYDLAIWKNGLAFKNIDFSALGRPVIKIAELKNGVTDQTARTLAEYDPSVFVRAGDMLFSWSGNPDTSIDVFRWEGEDGWLNQHIFKVTPKAGITEEFLFFALKWLRPRFAEIARNKQTTGLGHVTIQDLKRMVVGVPEPDEQRAIVGAVGSLQSKIDLNRQMNKTLEAMAQAIFRDWFAEFGPIRAKMDGRVPYLAPALWALFPDRLDGDGKPEGWVASTVGDEVVVVGGSTPRTNEPQYWNGDIAWATPKDLSVLRGPVLLDTERRITAAGLERIGSGLLPAGVVLLSSRAPIGYIAIAQLPTAVNQGFIAMVCRKRVSNVFVWLWTHANMDRILQNANGSTFQEISKANFRPIPMVVAESAVLTAFDEMIGPMFDHICANEHESQRLTALRDLLLPKLMSGKIRVKGVEMITAAA